MLGDVRRNDPERIQDEPIEPVEPEEQDSAAEPQTHGATIDAKPGGKLGELGADDVQSDEGVKPEERRRRGQQRPGIHRAPSASSRSRR